MKWAALLVAPIIFAAPAHADSGDQDYLDTLKANGITFSSSHDVILYGHGVCLSLSQGESFKNIVTDITTDYESLPRKAAEGLAGAAVMSYCPSFQSSMIEARLEQPRTHS